MPVADYTSFRHQFRELRREVRLLALAHERDYPLARDLSELFTDHGRLLTVSTGSRRDPRRARARATPPPTSPCPRAERRRAGSARLVDMLDLTDAFGREERMLSLARTPEQRSFQSWFLGEFVRPGRRRTRRAPGSRPRRDHAAADSPEAGSRSSVS